MGVLNLSTAKLTSFLTTALGKTKFQVQESQALFAPPLYYIFNRSIRTSVWPARWKNELTTFIPKKQQPSKLDEMRPIVRSEVWSKLEEYCLRESLLEDLRPNLDPAQFGGLKGMSPDLVLAKIYQDITNAAEKGYMSILLATDQSKAFNSLLHSEVVEAAARLGIRPPLVRLIASYLDSRTTTVQWNDVISKPRPCRGGSGQGTLWSVLLFIITIDGLLAKLRSLISAEEEGLEMTSKLYAYCDDVSAVVFFKNSNFTPDSAGQRVFRDDGRLQKYLGAIADFSSQVGLRLNPEKTKAVCFDYSRNRIVIPQLFDTEGKIIYSPIAFPSGDFVGAYEEIKLLGVQLQQDMRLDSLVRERRKRGLQAVWQLRRLQDMGVARRHLLVVYKAYVRSRIETGVTSAASMLNFGQFAHLEAPQRRATRALLGLPWRQHGPSIPDYDERLDTLGLQSMETRISTLFTRFTFKCEAEPRLSTYFQAHSDSALQRRRPRHYDVPRARTERMRISPFASMARVLNQCEIAPAARLQR